MIGLNLQYDVVVAIFNKTSRKGFTLRHDEKLNMTTAEGWRHHLYSLARDHGVLSDTLLSIYSPSIEGHSFNSKKSLRLRRMRKFISEYPGGFYFIVTSHDQAPYQAYLEGGPQVDKELRRLSPDPDGLGKYTLVDWNDDPDLKLIDLCFAK